MNTYVAMCVDPATGQRAEFIISAPTEANADMQARDGFFGLLGVDPEKRAALEVQLTDFGAKPARKRDLPGPKDRVRHIRTEKVGTFVGLVGKDSARVAWDNGVRGIGWLRDLEKIPND